MYPPEEKCGFVDKYPHFPKKVQNLYNKKIMPRDFNMNIQPLENTQA